MIQLFKQQLPVDIRILLGKFSFGEIIRFGLSGVGVTVIHLTCYYGMLVFFDYKISNVFALIAAKISAFLLNKYWVFQSMTVGMPAVIEIIKYILVRVVFTGCLDYFGMIILVDFCGFDEKIVKLPILILVMILNFLLGKFFIFQKKND